MYQEKWPGSHQVLNSLLLMNILSVYGWECGHGLGLNKHIAGFFCRVKSLLNFKLLHCTKSYPAARFCGLIHFDMLISANRPIQPSLND